MTKIIDFAKLDFAALRESVDMESRADLMAVAGNFGEASYLMNRANRIRSSQFGGWNPNELRDFTNLALAQVDRNPEGHDPAEGHGAKHESPVVADDAPEH